MSDRSHRPPPIRTNRTTRSGADFDTLAVSARRDATDPTFAIILQLEDMIQDRVREVEWRKKHASRFTARWFHATGLRILYFVALAAVLGHWVATSADSKEARVIFEVSYTRRLNNGTPAVEANWFTGGMTQHVIDSLVKVIVARDARGAAPR